MAVNNERSMNHDLMLGMTDRTYHRLTPSRGGIVETEWPLYRAQHLMAGSWRPEYLADAASDPEDMRPDQVLREKISIVTGPTRRTRPVAKNQWVPNPYDTPLDAVHTSWPDRW